MIKNNFIKIKISSRHVLHFKNLGYKNVKCNNDLLIKTIDLPKGSNLKIDIICESCYIEKSSKYQDYIKYTKNLTEEYLCEKCNYIKNEKTYMNMYGVKSHMHVKELVDMYKQNILNKYGVDHFSKTKMYKEKYKKTCIEKYGVDNTFKSESIKSKILINKRISMEKSKQWIPIDQKSDWIIYKQKCRRLTRNNIKLLDWDGHDYYDNEYIKDNFDLHYFDNNYPTIDHKISIYDGFTCGIRAEDISNVNNLCWTKRILNISKNKKSYLK